MTKHFFLYDTESLSTLASEETIRKGLDYFAANRVFDLDCSEHTLSAFVEGSVSDEPHTVNLTRSNDDQLILECSCDNVKESTCKHCIATLYAYADKYYAENDPIVEQVGIGATHNMFEHVERLVEFQLTESGVIFSGAAPIQFELPNEEPRKWEGLARLGERGFLVATDKSPDTVFGFVERNTP